VLWNRPGGNRRRHAPSVVQEERGNAGGQDNRSAENRAGDCGDKRRVRLARNLLLRRWATVVRLQLSDDMARSAAVRFTLVRRACAALGAARHASFRIRHPSRADSRVAASYRQYDRQDGETPQAVHHCSKAADYMLNCQIPSLHGWAEASFILARD